MKCPGCASEVSDNNRFCIYCGQKLTASSKRMVAHSTRTPSGVMRLRRKADFSQTSLPEIQQGTPKLNLASLSSSSFSAISPSSKEDTDMPRSTQSPELKDLLSKLGNTKPSTQPQTHTQPSLPKFGFDSSEFDEVDDEDDVKELGFCDEEDEKVSLDSLDPEDDIEAPIPEPPRMAPRPSLKDTRSFGRIRTSSVSISNETDSQTEKHLSEDNLSLGSMELEKWANEGNEEDSDDSGPIPMGSGTFARTPSGGFKLALESFKSTCRGLFEKAQDTFHNIRHPRSSKKSDASRSMTVTDLKKKEERRKIIAIALVAVALLAVIGVVVSMSSKTSNEPVVTSVATNDSNTYELVDLGDDGNTVADNDVPTFEPDEFAFDFIDEPTDNKEPVIAPAAQPKAVVAETPVETETQKNNASSLTEARKYGHTDNLFIGSNKPETYKLTRSCVMREGPASRFPLVTELKPGQKVEILTTTDEDWLFQNGVWTKSGQTNRLGPGSQFAEAQKGMTVAAPSSRVISAKNWRYLKAGKNYGYVGPACFK